MKSLKEFKLRMRVGAVLKLVHATGAAVANVGLDRPITESNSVGIALATPVADGTTKSSYLNWPKATELLFFGDNKDRFRVDSRGVTLVFDIVREAA